MKKVISALIASTLVLSMGTISAFAQSETLDSLSSKDIDVNAIYSEGTTTPTVYSVNIEWGAMEFAYNVGGTKDWNPENHSYEDNSTASWSANGNNLTVTNHSNAAVDATLSFSAIASGITAGFYDAVTAGNAISNNKLALASAVDTATTSAPVETAYLRVTGGSVSANGKIGTITVTLAAPSSSSGDGAQDGGSYGRE